MQLLTDDFLQIFKKASLDVNVKQTFPLIAWLTSYNSYKVTLISKSKKELQQWQPIAL